jgi:hypothetical protein
MSAASFAVPLEAVCNGADFAGKILLAQLIAERAAMHDAAVVERGAEQWVATILYTAPGNPTRQQIAHVGLLWPMNPVSPNQELRHAL